MMQTPFSNDLPTELPLKLSKDTQCSSHSNRRSAHQKSIGAMYTRLHTHALKSTWLRIDANGNCDQLQVERIVLMETLGLRSHDFRVLESHSMRQEYHILSRDRCICVHLEYIKCIITAKHVLLALPDNDRSSAFISSMREGLQLPPQDKFRRPTLLKLLKKGTLSRVPEAEDATVQHEVIDGDQTAILEPRDEDLPFELHALEICLHEYARDLEERIANLDCTIRAVSDRLSNTVRNESLEVLRGHRGRIVNISLASHKITDALEELLSYERELLAMCLSYREQKLERLTRRAVEKYQLTEPQTLEKISYFVPELPEADTGFLSEYIPNSAVHVSKVDLLLSSYLLSFGNMYRKLEDLSESVDDTVAMVNIKLDAHQNKLIAVTVIFDGIHTINYMAVGIGGFLTMNLLPEGDLGNNWASAGAIIPGATGAPKLGLYLSYCITAVIGSYVIFAFLLMHFFRKGMIQFG
ncbi:hypothetical protein CEUSTIGMA_g9683.t1 [Chlamydomonas eustigma]|uniref:Magnesium transporter n=1 Tax=Chlamydomonas eustigma TaxID=1157962 RepID=A0A250XGP9_9CHLO|nr:hypothetical protein CEUSTIGMA_g9683.t1 [Chlamydomonas eustigma]|eukprot:GAX82255.1 hypothetical protein CEUSTIGMA_g9683.t1 [Chlamydomonas eustigma]